MDKESFVEECLLEEHEEHERTEAENEGDNEEDEVVVPAPHFFDSEDDVNDGDYEFDKNAPERVAIGLNSDPAVEEAHLATGDTDIQSDDTYYPSSEELHTDYSSGEENNYMFPNFVPEKELFDPKFEVGKTFKDMELFRKAVRNHGVVSRCNFRFRPNDDRRAQAICKLGCKWRIWASLNNKLGCVQVKSYNPTHTCSRDRMNRHCTAKYVAERYLDTFRIDPEWKTKLIRKAVKDDLKLNINKVTAWRARRWARILIEGGDEHQFGLLWSYASELDRTNPGSTCKISVFESRFQGIYVCLAACKQGFKLGCRQLLGLDGCFLKGTFGGQMLTAVALDANNSIYPVAFAIVEKENTITWRWFVRHLGDDLGIVNSREWTFMSDRQKGLQNVIEDMYPDAEHRFCVRHMYTNFFRTDFKGLALKEYLWRAAKSTTVSDYKFWMDEIKKESNAAYEWLMKRAANQCSKSHFSTYVKSDILLNNLCECFNSIVLDDREKSILAMLIDMHIGFMKRIYTRRDKMLREGCNICPKIVKSLTKHVDMCSNNEVDWNGGSQWYVKGKDGEFVVDIHARTCACRRWDLTGIPCGHACAAILDYRDDPLNYVHECYQVKTYLRCYENLIMPINGKKLWPEVDKVPIKPPGWILTKRGRRQKKRRRQQEEDVMMQSQGTTKMKRKGVVVMTCSVCGLSGHNKRYHDKEDAPYEDWSAFLVEPLIESQNTSTTQAGNKLQARRSKKSTNRTSEDQPQPSELQFMPTPGLNHVNDSLVNSGPAVYNPSKNDVVEDIPHTFTEE